MKVQPLTQAEIDLLTGGILPVNDFTIGSPLDTTPEKMAFEIELLKTQVSELTDIVKLLGEMLWMTKTL